MSGEAAMLIQLVQWLKLWGLTRQDKKFKLLEISTSFSTILHSYFLLLELLGSCTTSAIKILSEKEED